MDIQCTNPKCRADNPANAKFCRKCGTAFTSTNKYKQMIKVICQQDIYPKSKHKCQNIYTRYF